MPMTVTPEMMQAAKIDLSPTKEQAEAVFTGGGALSFHDEPAFPHAALLGQGMGVLQTVASSLLSQEAYGQAAIVTRALADLEPLLKSLSNPKPEPFKYNGYLIPKTALDYLANGNKIEAIKILRMVHGLGLAASKDLLEEMIATNPHLYHS